jgi:hypothetical protein
VTLKRQLLKLEVQNWIDFASVASMAELFSLAAYDFIENLPFEDILHENCGGPVKLPGRMARRRSLSAPCISTYITGISNSRQLIL